MSSSSSSLPPHAKEEQVALTTPALSVPESEPKRRRLEPRNDTMARGEMVHIPPRGRSSPPPTSGTDTNASVLPPHRYPPEQTFTAFMAIMNRELREMRHAAGAITGLRRDGSAMRRRMDDFQEDLHATDDAQRGLLHMIMDMRVEMTTLTGRVVTAETRAAAAEARVAEFEAMVVAAADGGNEDREDEEPLEDDGSESTIASA